MDKKFFLKIIKEMLKEHAMFHDLLVSNNLV